MTKPKLPPDLEDLDDDEEEDEEAGEAKYDDEGLLFDPEEVGR